MKNNVRLACERLCAGYGSRQIFDGVGFSFPSGLFALRGANGIGKSTLLRVLAGVQRPTEGCIWIDGIDLLRAPESAKKRLSYVPDDCPIYPFMTGRELLAFVAAARKATLGADVRDLLSVFALEGYGHTRFDAMSLGVRRKMMLCTAWIGTPRVMLLDEPGNGLDSTARSHLAGLLRQAGQSRVVLFSTHDDDLVAASGAVVVEMEALLG